MTLAIRIFGVLYALIGIAGLLATAYASTVVHEPKGFFSLAGTAMNLAAWGALLYCAGSAIEKLEAIRALLKQQAPGSSPPLETSGATQP
jgi:hypothetical protein